MKLLGFEIKRSEEPEKELKSFVSPTDDSGAVEVAAYGGGAYGSIVDLEGTAKNEAELVTRYRRMRLQPEVQFAVDDIVNESIIMSDTEPVVSLNLDGIRGSDTFKDKITDEFKYVLELLNFHNEGYETFEKWYVDGRIYFHVIVDEENSGKNGIEEVRFVDPRKIRKVKEVENVTDPNKGVTLKRIKNEYYIYSDRGYLKQGQPSLATSYGTNIGGIRIAKDAMVHVTSGLVNETNDMVLSHLHKAIKTMNQLHMLEDATVIYRISRAPERRIFYIDVGNLPKAKAEQYLRDMMTRYKNKTVYDPQTGEIKDARRFQTMLEDFWLPRREGGKGTEITSLPGGQNLGEIEDIHYFQKKLYKSLNVPISRLETETGFSFGRPSEITRDEIKFAKFITRLRRRFSQIFLQLLEKQLILKRVIREQEWEELKDQIRFKYLEDNHFEEVKEAEVLRERIETVRAMEDMVGTYFSKEWVRKNILKQSDEDIQDIEKQIAGESADDPDMMQQAPAPANPGSDDKNAFS